MKEKGYLFSYSLICVRGPERKSSHTPLYTYQYADNPKKPATSSLKKVAHSVLSPNAVIHSDLTEGFKI